MAPKGRRTSRNTTVRRLSFQLSDLFDEDQVEDKVAAARRRVIGAFHFATEMHNGKLKGTDNYISGVEPKMGALAKYVLSWMKDPFIKPWELPDWTDEFTSFELNRLIYELQYDVMMAALYEMCVRPPKTPPGFNLEASSDEIHYDSIRCYWQIRQSSIDEYKRNQQAARKLLKVDNRCYHGRERGQSKRRNIPAGVSVSFG